MKIKTLSAEINSCRATRSKTILLNKIYFIFFCFVGNPLPSVFWFRNNRRLNPWRIIVEDVEKLSNSFSSRLAIGNLSGPIYQNGHRSVISLLVIKEPGRADIGTLLRCQANSPDTQKPIIRLFKLDVNCKLSMLRSAHSSITFFLFATANISTTPTGKHCRHCP